MKLQIDEDSPKVEFPPPLFVLICMLGSWMMHSVVPISINISRPVANFLGFTSLGIGFGLIFTCVFLFKTNNTNIQPWKTTSCIIKTGPYSYSRNPIYLGMLILQFAVTLFLRSYIGILFLLFLLGFLRFFVIQNEEEYLTEKFGSEYTEYQKRVTRWLTSKHKERK